MDTLPELYPEERQGEYGTNLAHSSMTGQPLKGHYLRTPLTLVVTIYPLLADNVLQQRDNAFQILLVHWSPENEKIFSTYNNLHV